MKKRAVVGIVSVGILLLVAGSSGNKYQSSNLNNAEIVDTSSAIKITTEKVTPICDGTAVTTNCALDSIKYTTYIYHPAVAEKSHTETVTTYKQEVASYCTLCNDGTYSPSCATGRGACSHHGGVAQWNAPRYKNVPEYSTKTVIDTPAQEAYYEKATE